MILRATPLLEGDQTVIEVFNEKEEHRALEKDPKWTMSKDKMKVIFDNLTMCAGRRAEREWDQESSATAEADSKEIEAWAARPSTTYAHHGLGSSSVGRPHVGSHSGVVS